MCLPICSCYYCANWAPRVRPWRAMHASSFVYRLTNLWMEHAYVMQIAVCIPLLWLLYSNTVLEQIQPIDLDWPDNFRLVQTGLPCPSPSHGDYYFRQVQHYTNQVPFLTPTTHQDTSGEFRAMTVTLHASTIISPAFVAFFPLIIIQVSIGTLYKLSQVNGKYPYAPSAALALSEALKAIISLLSEWRLRRRTKQSDIKGILDLCSHETKDGHDANKVHVEHYVNLHFIVL